MTFDAEIAVAGATIGVPAPEALAEGADPEIELHILTGLGLPVPDPRTGGQLVVPLGKLRFTFPREQAIELFGQALKAAEDLPKRAVSSGKIAVASSMADVAQAADNMQRVTGR